MNKHTQDCWQALFAQLAALQAGSAQPGSCMVLLPFGQLLPIAGKLWAQQQPTGLLPRFATTQTWAQNLPPLTGVQAPGAEDFQFDMAQDSLRARDLLTQTGLQAQSEHLYPQLLAYAQPLAQLARAQAPATRAAWADNLRLNLPATMPSEHNRYERALLAIALEWVAHSNYHSDVLFSSAAGAGWSQLLLVQGLQQDTLAQNVAAYWQTAGKTTQAWDFSPALDWQSPQLGQVRSYALHSSADLLHSSAQLALELVQDGQRPVALITQDRHISRQMRAVLAKQGLRIRDETGWKLSTTHAAGTIFSVLQAALAPHSSAAQLAWLKAALGPAHAALLALEGYIYKEKTLASLDKPATAAAQKIAALCAELLPSITQLAQLLSGRQRLDDWQQRLYSALQLHGLAAQLEADDAGSACLQALQAPSSNSRSLSLVQFAAWVRDVLESGNYLPTQPADCDIVFLPLAQMLGRDFAAVLLPGADSERLPLYQPKLTVFSPAQLALLGLPDAQAQAATLQQAWLQAACNPTLHALWAQVEDGQERSASPLLLAWQQVHGVQTAPLEPHMRKIDAAAQLPPQAEAGDLRITHISASAYEDLRNCPYRYFAKNLLKLRPTDELEEEPDQQDWGNFVHATLLHFHQARQNPSALPQALADAELLAQSAAQQMQTLVAQQSNSSMAALLLPYAYSWPKLAANYLEWLAGAEAEGWRFQNGEFQAPNPPQLPLADGSAVQLRGTIDRLDAKLPSEQRLLDYKTGDAKKLMRKVASIYEDTQLPFYALLLGDDAAADLGAAYLAVREGETTLIPHPAITEAAQALAQGLIDDLSRIHAGTPMQALGAEDDVCGHCEMRGMCRKDFWPAQAA